MFNDACSKNIELKTIQALSFKVNILSNFFICGNVDL